MRATQTLTVGLVVAALAVPVTVTSAAGAESSATAPESAQIVLDWERIAFATVYPATPIPIGVPVLGFTSVAMHEAAQSSLDRRNSSETAAVAVAAHHVLVHYYPAAKAALDAQLTVSLRGVPDGRAESRGLRVGRAAAAELLASREGDGYGDASIHYTLPPAIGVWQPTPPETDMVAPWLGSLRPLVLDRLMQVDGPDALTSRQYAADYNEVKRLGSVGSTTRSPEQTDTAVFYNSNSATMIGDATIRHLEANPMGLGRTARLFAAMHAAMTDSLIKCFQLKRDVGFWRPFQAIARAGADRNPRTSPQPGWEPLIPNPPYADYVSGHACVTGPAIMVVREMIGEDTALTLRLVGYPDRAYAHLRDIERDAFHARIWGGLHFRDAMEDGYSIAHRTARQVLHELD